MNIISIDPSSTAAGFAYFKDDELKFVEVLKQKGSHLVDRMQKMNEYLISVLKKEKPKYIAIETPYLGMNRAVSMKMGQIFGMFIAACTSLGYSSEYIIEIHPMTAKKAAGLERKAKRAEAKEIVLNNLKEKFPKIEICDDNAADAIAVGLAAINRLREENNE